MSAGSLSDWRSRGASDRQHLRQRLRAGALAMSRSAVTQTEILEERIIDVGEGVVANVWEQLLARLEQHGLRRCLAGEEEEIVEVGGVHNNNNNNNNINNKEKEENLMGISLISSTEEHHNEDARAPYYYICVPCELRITQVSNVAGTLEMLQDAHYHFSSADHRRIASWMGEPDIDCTLLNSSELDPTEYTRIFVNGIPFLISNRPGGGDMFFPLPHEIHDRDRLNTTIGTQKLEELLTSNQPGTEIWHRPLDSIFTESRQLLYRAESRQKLRTKKWLSSLKRRCCFIVQHIPKEIYERNSFVEIPTVPALFEVNRKRLPKEGFNNNEEEIAFRTKYVVADKPFMIWKPNLHPKKNKTLIRHNGIYRVALIKSSDAEKIISEKSNSKEIENHIPIKNNSQILTTEALSQVRNASVVKWFKSELLDNSDINSSDVFARTEEISDVSS